MGLKMPQLSARQHKIQGQESNTALAASMLAHVGKLSLVKNNTGEVWNVVGLFLFFFLNLQCVC